MNYDIFKKGSYIYNINRNIQWVSKYLDIKDIKNYNNTCTSARAIASLEPFWYSIFSNFDVPLYDYLWVDRIESNADDWLRRLYYSRMSCIMANTIINKISRTYLTSILTKTNDTLNEGVLYRHNYGIFVGEIIFLMMKEITKGWYPEVSIENVLEAPIVFKLNVIEIKPKNNFFQIRVRFNNQYFKNTRRYTEYQLLIFIARLLYLNFILEINFQPYSDTMNTVNRLDTRKTDYRLRSDTIIADYG